MEIDSPQIQELVEHPSEGLSVEIKSWIDPDEPNGKAKIVRAALALRNHDGGFLVIGFDDNSLQPATEGIPDDIRATFHIDKIQGLISKFASEPFEVGVEFPEIDGQPYPVIVVPSGVRTPVAAKSELRDGENSLIRPDDIFVRSLRANNTPSTAKASWKDWPSIVEVCFENREADIGRFLRRHLAGFRRGDLGNLAAAIREAAEPEVSSRDRLKEYLHESEDRFFKLMTEREVELPSHGTWEVGFVIAGEVPPHNANREFRNLLVSSNPRYTGWPVWLDSGDFRDESASPFVYEDTWEALIVDVGSGWADHVDYMRMDPQGKFYLRRALQDDISGSRAAPTPMTQLDFGLAIIRPTEAIAVGLAFARVMGCDPESTTLSFAFRWKGLRNRRLSSWASPTRDIAGYKNDHQDEVTSWVDVPLEAPLSALSEYVAQVVQPLFRAFEGFEIGTGVIEDLSRRVIERKL